MQKKKTVVLQKHGNMMVVNPTNDEIFNLLKPVLSFTEKVTHRAEALRERKMQGLGQFEQVEHTLLEIDYKKK